MGVLDYNIILNRTVKGKHVTPYAT